MMREHLNGTWSIVKLPDQMSRLLELMGYNRMERKYFKSAKPSIKTLLADDHGELTLKLDTPLYKRTKTYKLDEQLVEYQDTKKNPVMEMARWVGPNTIEIKTIYPAKSMTVVETRTLLDTDQWHHKATIIEVENSWDIECLYAKK